MSRSFLVPIVLPANPTNPLEAATKQYVDANIGGGGSVTGTKLSALAAITGAILNALDLIEVVDVSDTTMAASGTNKKITMAELVNYLNTGGGPMFGFLFDTTTTTGTSTNGLRLNNATPASATVVYVNYTSREGIDLKTRLLAGTTGDRLYIQDRVNSAVYRVYELTGAPTDVTTYASIPVVHRGGAGSLWANGLSIVAGFTSPPITVSTVAPSSPLTNDIWLDIT